MPKVPTVVWNDILGQVRVNHPQLSRGWFADIEPVEIEGGVLRIRTCNDAQTRYLTQHCGAAFSEAAQAATGRLITAAFETPETNSEKEWGSSLPFDETDTQLQLNPDYTFDHFVTGPCNRLAHAAALAITEDLGKAYNPFFVYGPSGLGKTHLLQAVCHAVANGSSDAASLYISCETFINHFMEAVERGALNQFRYRYRHVSLLVIDDIQFLAERERSQEEFFHTFNTLHQSQRQIILSADCSPGEIPSLEDRLVSRFNSGLVALLDLPCLETRMSIVQKKAALRCIEVPENVIRFISSRIERNIRELEGALIKIDALSQTRSGVINLELAQEALGPGPTRAIPIPRILEVVSKRYNVKVADLQGKKRSKVVTLPRHVSMFLARQLTPRSLEDIGGYFGGRDHSTVLHASRTISQAAEEDPQLRELLDELTMEVKNGAY